MLAGSPEDCSPQTTNVCFQSLPQGTRLPAGFGLSTQIILVTHPQGPLVFISGPQHFVVSSECNLGTNFRGDSWPPSCYSHPSALPNPGNVLTFDLNVFAAILQFYEEIVLSIM